VKKEEPTEYDHLIEMMISGHIFDKEWENPKVKVPNSFRDADHYF
jgi:hypothetical protein